VHLVGSCYMDLLQLHACFYEANYSTAPQIIFPCTLNGYHIKSIFKKV